MVDVKNIHVKFLIFLVLIFISGNVSSFARNTKKNKTPCILLAKSDNPVKVSAWSPDGSVFFTGWENTLLVWDAAADKPVKSLSNITSPVVSISFSHDGKYFVVVTEDNSIIISYTKNYEEVSRFKGDEGAVVLDAIFSNDDLSIITTLDGRQVVNCFRLILTKKFHASTLQKHRNTVYSLSADSLKDQILSAGKEGNAILWDTSTNQQVSKYKIYAAAKVPPVFSPDGSVFAIPEEKDVITVNNRYGQMIYQIKTDGAFVNKMGFSPDSQLLAVALKKGGIAVYDADSGEKVRNLECIKANGRKTGSICDFSFSPDGNYVIGSTDKGCIYRWSLGGKVFAQSEDERKQIENQIKGIVDNNSGSNYAPEYSQIEAVADIPKENTKNTDNQGGSPSEKNGIFVPEDSQLVPAIKKASSMLYAGIGYTTIPTDIYYGNFDLDLGFQKSFKTLPFFVGFDVDLGMAIPKKDFPYTYYLANGQESSAPWLYTGKPELSFGCEAYPKAGLREFIELCAGPSVRFMWNNSKTASARSPLYYGYFAGIGVGIDIKGFTVKASCVYDSMFGIQNGVEIGGTIKFYSKKGGK